LGILAGKRECYNYGMRWFVALIFGCLLVHAPRALDEPLEENYQKDVICGGDFMLIAKGR